MIFIFFLIWNWIWDGIGWDFEWVAYKWDWVAIVPPSIPSHINPIESKSSADRLILVELYSGIFLNGLTSAKACRIRWIYRSKTVRHTEWWYFHVSRLTFCK